MLEGRDAGQQGQLDVGPAGRQACRRRGQHAAARHVADLQAGEVHRDPLAGHRRGSRLPVHVQPADLGERRTRAAPAPRRSTPSVPDTSVPVATVPKPRSEKVRSTGSRTAPPASRGRAAATRAASTARSASSPSPERADTGTIGARVEERPGHQLAHLERRQLAHVGVGEVDPGQGDRRRAAPAAGGRCRSARASAASPTRRRPPPAAPRRRRRRRPAWCARSVRGRAHRRTTRSRRRAARHARSRARW